MNAVKPKSEFTVADIRNTVLLVNSPTFLSSTPTNEELAALCILCKFLVQGIRAYGIFSGNTDGMDKIKEFYDGLKYSVFNKNGVFTEISIEHGGTSYDIPAEFLTETAKKEITDDMKKSIKELVYGLALLFSNTYTHETSIRNKSISFKKRPWLGYDRFNRKNNTFTFTVRDISQNNTMIQKIQTKMDNNNTVYAWYRNWVKMYHLFFLEYRCPIAITANIDIPPTPINNGTIVGKVLQTGGKSRARTKRAKHAMHAIHGSTKCKTQRTQRKQHKQHKYRKTQRNATRRK
jgi:hypothetical protein